MGQPRAPHGDDLPAARLLRDPAAVPLLLDGDHVVQTKRRTLRLQEVQSLPDRQPDARAHLQAAVPDRVPEVAGHDHERCSRLDRTVAVFQRAGRLRDPAAALPGQPVCRSWHLPRLSGAAVDPVHSAGHHGAPARVVRFADRPDPDLSDLPGSVLDLAADRILQVDPVRTGGVRVDRRGDATADPAADYAAAGRPGPHLSRHFLVHAQLERIHLLAGLHPEQREEDRAGRHPHRTGVGRRLSVGRADGRIAARLAAGGDLLLVLRRLLRLLAHRSGKGIGHFASAGPRLRFGRPRGEDA